jgi:hypothetical protein
MASFDQSDDQKAETTASVTDQVDEGPIPPMDGELFEADRDSLEAGTREALNELEDEIREGTESMSPEELSEAADRMRNGEIEYLERQSESPDDEIAARAKFVLGIKEEMDALIDSVNGDVKKGDTAIAEKKIRQFLQKTHESLNDLPLDGEDVEAALAQMEFLMELDLALIGATEETKSSILTFLSLGLDLVPFLGGAKMMAEGAVGTTLDGKDLHGMERMIHMGEGMFWEVVDVVAVAAGMVSVGTGAAAVETAAVAAKVGKGAKAAATAGRAAKAAHTAGTAAKAGKAAKGAKTAPNVSKTMRRTGAFMRKHGVEGSKDVYRAGQFLVENPRVEKVVQEGFEKGFEKRSKVTDAAKRAIKQKAGDVVQSHKEQVRLLNELNEERERLTRLLDEMASDIQTRSAA